MAYDAEKTQQEWNKWLKVKEIIGPENTKALIAASILLAAGCAEMRAPAGNMTDYATGSYRMPPRPRVRPVCGSGSISTLPSEKRSMARPLGANVTPTFPQQRSGARPTRSRPRGRTGILRRFIRLKLHLGEIRHTCEWSHLLCVMLAPSESIMPRL
jgi:hypothetical protein